MTLCIFRRFDFFQPRQTARRLDTRTLDSLWRSVESDPRAVVAQLGSARGAALLLRGIANLDSGDHAAALADFDAVIAEQADNPIVRKYRGLALFLGGNRPEAARSLASGVLFPDPTFFRRFLRVFLPIHLRQGIRGSAMLAAKTQVLGVAAEAIRKAGQATGPAREKIAEGAARRGEKCFWQKDYAGALALYEAAHQIAPENADFAANLGYMLLLSGRSARAGQLLEPIVAYHVEKYGQNPSTEAMPDPGLLVSWAWVLHERGAHREALAVLSGVHPEGYEDYDSHMLAALCWLSLGESANATSAVDKAFHEFFLDSWERFLEPFWFDVLAWLKRGGT